mmetsp:Transcript_68196/g.79370  ORF Transcript_68196/g.79370 Transcript_68196/m.79370 type:complete len:783 (+) Transcript_68196:59-2407(+)
MASYRQQPSKVHDHHYTAENRPLAIGANFHDDPICRSTLRKSHALGLDAPLPSDYHPHTSYVYNGSGNDWSWLYSTSASTYGGESAARPASTGSNSTADPVPVLRFLAYTREPIVESNAETVRIRRMGIVFHTQDGSIAIREARQPNSGIVQGQVLQRQRVPRDTTNIQDVLTIEDFTIGGTVVIFNKEYTIVDCDERTRKYLRETLKRVDVPDVGLPWPSDDDTYSAAAIKGLTFQPKKLIPTPIMDQKRVVEQLNSGIISKHPPDEVHMAKQFLQNKINEHLEFAALWDDRSKIGGDLRRCAIRFFLENDTIEIIEIRPDNAGREGSCKLLCRQRVTKDGSEVPVHKGLQNTFGVLLKQGFLEAPDIKIGSFLKVYARDYLVYDADAFTRSFMERKYGLVLPPAMDITEILQRGRILLPPQIPPPHDGYGTEEDSLQNWKYLSLKPPKADVEKLEREAGRIMVFAATLVAPCNPQDAGRQFVIRFDRATDEVEIIEQSIRNSGFIGGIFLSKRRHLKPLPDGRNVPFTPQDFPLGGNVTILGRTYQLDEMDKRSERLVRGIPDPITEGRVRELMISFKNALQAKFVRMHEAYRQIAPQGALTTRELREFFRGTSADISEDEAALLIHCMSPTGNGVVSYSKFIEVMDIPNSYNMDVLAVHPRSIRNINLAADSTITTKAIATASDAARRRYLTQQLVEKLDQRRGTVQEVFRLMAGHSSNGKMNRNAFSYGLKEYLHFNVTPEEHEVLVNILFDGSEDSNGDITVRQFHDFLERYQGGSG